MKSNGLIIKWCKNIKSYNKLIPILREYPNDYIITADENIFYPKDWIKNMWIQYKKTPNTIIVSRAKKISFDEYNNMMYYNEWKFINEYSGSSFLNFPMGDGGVLYYPNSLSNLVFDEEYFLKLCPTGEDIWFWAMAMLNKTKITTIENTLNDLIYINLARKSGILKEHTLECSNHKINTQIKNIITEFPVILKIINKE